MALPYIIAKLEDVDEAFRDLYVERDGKFVLDVENIPESKTDAQLARELADAERKRSSLEKDLHKERETKKELTDKVTKLSEADTVRQREVRELLKKAGLIEDDDDGKSTEGDLELKKRLQEIEEQKRQATVAAIERERDAAKIEVALIRELAGKVEDTDYALYRAHRTEAWGDVKVEDGKVQGLDAVLEALTEAEVMTKAEDDDDDKGDDDEKADAPASRRQAKLNKGGKPWREAKTLQEFNALPAAVQIAARDKEPEFVKVLEDRYYGSL